MLLWLSLSLFLELHISSTFHWVMEALDVSGFFCGGCPGKSSDSASPGCRTVHMLGMGNAGHSQNTHKGSLCAASGAQVVASIIWIEKSLCAGHLDRPRFSCLPSLTLQLVRKKADFTELRENIWEVGDRHITADHWLPLLMEHEGFAISISCSKA